MKILPLQVFPSVNNAVLRFMYYKIGRNVVFYSSSEVIGIVDLIVGDNTFIGHKVLIMGGKSLVKIGANCDISSSVSIITGSHELGGSNRRAGFGISKDIELGSGSWIGYGTIILGGVKIGDGCIIAAGSLVNKDIPSNCIAGGVPATIIRRLD